LALCHAGTVLSVVISEIRQARWSETARLADDVGSGVLSGSFLFVIGSAGEPRAAPY
jgi:hypothetical protein